MYHIFDLHICIFNSNYFFHVLIYLNVKNFLLNNYFCHVLIYFLTFDFRYIFLFNVSWTQYIKVQMSGRLPYLLIFSYIEYTNFPINSTPSVIFIWHLCIYISNFADYQITFSILYFEELICILLAEKPKKRMVFCSGPGSLHF